MNDLFDSELRTQNPELPVECLGQTFPSDQARREHYLKLLAEKLKDPEFRKIEGFPMGTDEDILALSDPPYYTACPNPFIAEFIQHYGKPYDPSVPYSREPMAVDVSVGKTDALYKAHSYHTKVPHLAIVPSILHYTEPGDIVLDGFAGSGMTGVAAQWCGVAPAAYRHELETEWKKQGKAAPKWGTRRVILNDLSPAATFISANYNLPFDVAAFAKAGKQLLKAVEEELGWMYETLHVEPASSRLKTLTGFRFVEPASVVSASSRLNLPNLSNQDSRQDAGSTKGISAFTRRRDNLPHWQLPGSFYFLTFNTEQNRQLSAEARQIVLDALRFFDGQRLNFIAAVVMPDHVHAVIQPLPKVEPASVEPASVEPASVEPASSRLNKADTLGGNNDLGFSRQDAGSTDAGSTDAGSTVYWDLSDLMHSIKSFSSNKINKIEGKVGTTVWQTETYDRIIRDDVEYAFTLQYIAYNPVRAGLSKTPEEYPWFVVGGHVREAGWKPAPLGRIEYTVWSQIFACPDCAGEVNFVEEALDDESKRVRDSFPCPHCGSELTKQKMDRLFINTIDKVTGNPLKTPKRQPALISYLVGNQRHEKTPDSTDLATLEKIDAMGFPVDFPSIEIPPMHMTHERARMDNSGITHIHHFFLPRAAQAMAALWRKANAEPDRRIRGMLVFFVEQGI